MTVPPGRPRLAANEPHDGRQTLMGPRLRWLKHRGVAVTLSADTGWFALK